MFAQVLISLLQRYWFHGLVGIVLVIGYIYYTITISSLNSKIKDLNTENQIQKETINSYKAELEFYEYNQTILEELYIKLDEIDESYEKENINNKKIIKDYIESKDKDEKEKNKAKKDLIDLFNKKFDRMK